MKNCGENDEVVVKNSGDFFKDTVFYNFTKVSVFIVFNLVSQKEVWSWTYYVIHKVSYTANVRFQPI